MRTAVSVETMRQSDQNTIKNGTSGLVLMHRAGESIYHAVSWHGKIAILCGSGNNGGDGYVLASLLQKNGYSPTLIRLSDRFSPDGKACYEEAIALGTEDCLFSPSINLSSYDIVVDCLLGTGFSGIPEGVMAAAIHAINRSGAYVVSVDINSGLNGDSGQSHLCVCSDLTVSVGTLKTGLLLGNAKDVIKDKINVDIGIPITGKSYSILEARDVAQCIPPRLHASHKGTYGYVTLLGGCAQYSGAVKLANLSCAAMRAGAGVCRLAVPAEITSSVAPYLLESTLEPIPSLCGIMQYEPAILDRLLTSSAAIGVGMGWGSGTDNERILTYLLSHSVKPLLIDADGLNTLARLDPNLLKSANCPIVLTPHVREFSRLCGLTDGEILSDPIRCAEHYAQEHGVILLLKGTTTIVTDGNQTYLTDRGCPGMATAGSGDVLSGVLTAFLGYLSVTPLTIAAGAYLTGRAGELAEKEMTAISMCASDTVKHLPAAIKEILDAKEEPK
ncbi:MAG: NAD(P)H-hydrate dehydratase [Clostridia bacterium]|nr:NAD(P)H-hydrate dehydratase [Clostridia bacterium]